MGPAIAAVILSLSLLAPGRSARAENPATIHRDGITISYWPGHETTAELSLSILLRARREIAAILQLPPTVPAAAVLAPGQKTFDERVGPWTRDLRLLGVAHSPSGTMVINWAHLSIAGENPLAVTLTHELVHVMLGDFEQRHQVFLPRWFEEGTACWISRILPVSPYDQRLRTAANQGALFPFYALEKEFPPYQADTEIAYLQSEDFIRFLASRYGRDGPAAILVALAQHREFHAAALAALNMDVLEEERIWIARLRSRFPVLWILWNHVDVLTAGALLTLISFVLYRRRRARLLAAWDRENAPSSEAEDVPPDSPETRP